MDVYINSEFLPKRPREAAALENTPDSPNVGIEITCSRGN